MDDRELRDSWGLPYVPSTSGWGTAWRLGLLGVAAGLLMILPLCGCDGSRTVSLRLDHLAAVMGLPLLAGVLGIGAAGLLWRECRRLARALNHYVSLAEPEDDDEQTNLSRGRGGHRGRLASLLVAALGLGLSGCAGLEGPAARQALELSGRIEADRAEAAAETRGQLRAAWRALALARFRKQAEEQEGGLSVEAAVQAARDLLGRVERADKILAGYAEMDARLGAQAAELRAAVAQTLRELEDRSAALERLGEAATGAAEAVAAERARRDE